MLKKAITSFSGRKLLKFSSNLFLVRFAFWNESFSAFRGLKEKV